MQIFDLNIADLAFRFTSNSKNIYLDEKRSVKSYKIEDPIYSPDFFIEYYLCDYTGLEKCKLVFSGEPELNSVLNYKWRIYSNQDSVVIKVFFIDHPQIATLTAELFENNRKVNIFLQYKENISSYLPINPLIHPLGSLLMLYLFHWKAGLLIHASSVLDGNKAYLFTGVSGIGKSTMARLWNECGAKVLNDDRMVLRIIENRVMVYNNPMPYYIQEPAQANLDKIFLLRQSASNYIKPMGGVTAYARVLGNFIQQFYQPKMVKRHLENVEEMINKVRVYEVGFKPDYDIVEMIRQME